MSPKQSNTSDSLWILEGQGKPFFCRSATWTFLRICRVIIYQNVAMLLKPSVSWLVGCRWHNSHALPSVQGTGPWKILPGTKVIPGYKFGGKHVINFQMAVEIRFLFGKTIILLLSDDVNVISFAGFGYFSFFWNRELFPIVRLHIYILLHFTFEFSGAAIPIPRPKICSNALS